jgi:hypothetical protein
MSAIGGLGPASIAVFSGFSELAEKLNYWLGGRILPNMPVLFALGPREKQRLMDELHNAEVNDKSQEEIWARLDKMTTPLRAAMVLEFFNDTPEEIEQLVGRPEIEQARIVELLVRLQEIEEGVSYVDCIMQGALVEDPDYWIGRIPGMLQIPNVRLLDHILMGSQGHKANIQHIDFGKIRALPPERMEQLTHIESWNCLFELMKRFSAGTCSRERLETLLDLGLEPEELEIGAHLLAIETVEEPFDLQALANMTSTNRDRFRQYWANVHAAPNYKSLPSYGSFFHHLLRGGSPLAWELVRMRVTYNPMPLMADEPFWMNFMARGRGFDISDPQLVKILERVCSPNKFIADLWKKNIQHAMAGNFQVGINLLYNFRSYNPKVVETINFAAICNLPAESTAHLLAFQGFAAQESRLDLLVHVAQRLSGTEEQRAAMLRELAAILEGDREFGFSLLSWQAGHPNPAPLEPLLNLSPDRKALLVSFLGFAKEHSLMTTHPLAMRAIVGGMVFSNLGCNVGWDLLVDGSIWLSIEYQYWYGAYKANFPEDKSSIQLPPIRNRSLVDRRELEAFLARIRTTIEYAGNLRSVILWTMRMLRGMEANEEFGAACRNEIHDALTGCHNRIAHFLRKIAIRWLICCDGEKDDAKVAKLLIGQARENIIDEWIAARYDDLQGIYRFQYIVRQLQKEFDLPFIFEDVNDAPALEVSPEELQHIRDTVKDKTDFAPAVLMADPIWEERIKKKYSPYFEKINAYYLEKIENAQTEEEKIPFGVQQKEKTRSLGIMLTCAMFKRGAPDLVNLYGTVSEGSFEFDLPFLKIFYTPEDLAKDLMWAKWLESTAEGASILERLEEALSHLISLGGDESRLTEEYSKVWAQHRLAMTRRMFDK